MKRILVAMIGALVASILIPQAALAEERVCRSTIRNKTLDNVKVPQGAECTLKGTRVKGAINVNNNARLEAINVRVIGNVQGEDARNVIVRRNSRVGGSVQVVQGKKGKVANSKINGDILFDEQSGRVVIKRSNVGGSVQAFQNDGGVRIKGNTIDGNLQCKENTPRPTGGNNEVHESKEDQCKNL